MATNSTLLMAALTTKESCGAAEVEGLAPGCWRLFALVHLMHQEARLPCRQTTDFVKPDESAFCATAHRRSAARRCWPSLSQIAVHFVWRHPESKACHKQVIGPR